MSGKGGTIVPAEGTIPDYETAYKNAIANDPKKTKEMIDDYQQLEPISSVVGLDQELKRNYLLEFAMRNPKEYIRKRNEMLLQMKTDVNEHFTTVYKRVRDTLPAVQARDVALKAALNFKNGEMLRLESMYPSEFSQKSYTNELNRQVALNQLSLGSVVPKT